MSIIISMENVYIIALVILVTIIFIYIGIILRREGFDSEIKTHPQFSDKYQKKFNNIGAALNATRKVGRLGEDTRGILGNVTTSISPSGNLLEQIDNPYPLEPMDSGLLLDVKMCEKVTASKCSAFDDPKFSSKCGLCMDIGTNSINDKSLGGLLLLEKDKQYARDNRKEGFLPDYEPTVGSCPAGMFVTTKDECLKLEKQIQCRKSSTFNSPEGCSQCYTDSSYSILDSKYDADLIRGSGTLYLKGIGILEYQEIGQGRKSIINLSKLTEPYKITLIGGEMTNVSLHLKKAIVAVPYDDTVTYQIDDMVIYNRYIYTMVEGANAPGYNPERDDDRLWNKEMLESEYVAPLPNYLAGYLSGSTSEESSFTFDLFRLILTDSVSGRKPRAIGSMSMKSPNGNDDVEVTKMGPIYGKKEMNLLMKSPFTFVDPFSQEASVCAGSPFVTKPESARLLASDSCYKKGSGPGTYGMSCLQAMFLNNGCVETGKGYPTNSITMSELLYDYDGNPLNLQSISDYIYSKAVTTSTGLDSNGKQLTIKKWSDASVFCTGVAITSPCDIGDKETGPLSSDCLEYLWDNRGENKKQGATYNVTSFSRSMFGSGMTNRFCTKAGTMSPRDETGKDNNMAINYWKKKGGVNAVRSLMANIHYDANNESIPEDAKKEKILQCYGMVPNQRPSYNTTFQSDSSVQTTLIPFKKKVVSNSGATLLCLYHHWTEKRPHLLMTMDGKEWFVPNIHVSHASARVFMTKLNNTYYYACMYGVADMLYSSKDGKNWDRMATAIDNKFREGYFPVGIVGFKNKLYVAMYDKGLFSSGDGGNTWTHIDIYVSHLQQMKIFNNKLYLVNRYNVCEFDETTNTSKAISPNLRGGNGWIVDLVYDAENKRYLISAAGEGGPGPTEEMLYWSDDLVKWYPSTGTWSVNNGACFWKLIKAFGKWWTAGWSASRLLCSTDGGKTWNEVKNAPRGDHASIFFYAGKLYFWGMYNPANEFYYTTDGIKWTQDKSVDSLMNGEHLFWSCLA